MSISAKESREKKVAGIEIEGKRKEELEPKPITLEPLVKKGSRGTLAGIILIIASLFAILSWVFAAVLFNVIKVELMTQIVIAIWIAIFATLALLGGALALIRKGWGLALACSILGLLSFGFLVSTLLCALAMIILILAKKEFD